MALLSPDMLLNHQPGHSEGLSLWYFLCGNCSTLTRFSSRLELKLKAERAIIQVSRILVGGGGVRPWMAQRPCRKRLSKTEAKCPTNRSASAMILRAAFTMPKSLMPPERLNHLGYWSTVRTCVVFSPSHL